MVYGRLQGGYREAYTTYKREAGGHIQEVYPGVYIGEVYPGGIYTFWASGYHL